MSCESVHGSLVALLDGEVDAAECRVLEAHLASCAACRRERDLLQATRTVLSAELRRTSATGGSFDALWQRVDEAMPDAPADGTRGRVVPLPARGGASGVGRAPRRTAAWAAAAGFAAAAGLTLALVGLPRDGATPPASGPAPRVAVAPPPAAEPAVVAQAPSRQAPPRRASEPPVAVAKAPEPLPAAPASDPAPDETTAVALGEADPPRDLLERPDLFVNYTIVRKLEELRHLDAVLAESPEGGKQGGAG